MASIEFDPENSEFPEGSWHFEGQMNEKIAATALYHFNIENISPSRLAFRMQTNSYLSDEIQTAQDDYNYVERVYGTLLGSSQGIAGVMGMSRHEKVVCGYSQCLSAPRVFFPASGPHQAWPQTIHCPLAARSSKRITSTANVPPQQKDWWTGDKSGDSISKGLIDVKEAREHRLKLMDERTAGKARRHWQSTGYNFCEH